MLEKIEELVRIMLERNKKRKAKLSGNSDIKKPI